MNYLIKHGLVRDLNPGPLAPKARIIPLDQRALLTVELCIKSASTFNEVMLCFHAMFK